MSSLSERYGIVFDAAVEIDRVDLKSNEEMYQQVAHQLENSPAVRQLESAADDLGTRAGTRMNEALSKQVKGIATSLRTELQAAVTDDALGRINIDPQMDREKFRENFRRMTAGMDDLFEGTLTDGLGTAVEHQVKTGFDRAFEGADRQIRIDADVHLTGTLNEELQRVQNEALDSIGVGIHVENLESVKKTLEGFRIDATLTPQARSAIEAVQAIQAKENQVLRLSVQGDEAVDRLMKGMNALIHVSVDTKNIDWTGLYRASADAGRIAGREAARHFKRSFNAAISAMSFRVNVDANVGRVVTPSGAKPVLDVETRTDGHPSPRREAPRREAAPSRPDDARWDQAPVNPQPPFDPNRHPDTVRQPTQQSRGAAQNRDSQPPAQPAPQAVPQTSYVRPGDRLDQRHWALRNPRRDDRDRALSKTAPTVAENPKVWQEDGRTPVAGRVPVRTGSHMRAFEGEEFVRTIPDVARDAQGRVLTAMSDDVKIGKRFRGTGYHRRQLAIRGRENNRVETFYTVDRAPGPDGTAYVSRDIEPIVERETFARAEHGRTLGEPLLKVGDPIPAGSERRIVEGSHQTVKARKSDVDMVVKAITPELSENGSVRGYRVQMESADGTRIEDVTVDVKGPAKGAAERRDFGRDLKMRDSRTGRITPRPDIMMEAGDETRMAMNFWRALTPEERTQHLGEFVPEATRTKLGLTPDRIREIANTPNEKLQFHGETLLPAFEAVAPRYERRAEWWQEMTEANAVRYLQDYYKKEYGETLAQGEVLPRANRDGYIYRGDDYNPRVGHTKVRTMFTGLQIPQVATLEEDFRPRQRWLSYDDVEQIARHNPEYANRIRQRSTGEGSARWAYGQMINAWQANEKNLDGGEHRLDHAIRADEMDFDKLRERERELLAQDLGTTPDELRMEDVERERLAYARLNAFNQLYGEGVDGKGGELLPEGKSPYRYVEFEEGGKPLYLAAGDALNRFASTAPTIGADGSTSLDQAATGYLTSWAHMIEALEGGGREDRLSAFARLTQSQYGLTTGGEFMKRAQGYFLPKDMMSGHKLRISQNLQSNEAYFPDAPENARSVAVGRAPYVFGAGNAGGIRLLSKAEAEERGLNPREAYINTELATAVGGDTDGDNVTGLFSEQDATDAQRKRREVRELRERRVRQGTNDQVDAPYGTKSMEDLLKGLRNPRALTIDEISENMGRYNELTSRIGSLYNDTKPRIRASALGEINAGELDFIDELHGQVYNRAQAAKELPAQLERVMQALGTNDQSRAHPLNIERRRSEAFEGLLTHEEDGKRIDPATVARAFSRDPRTIDALTKAGRTFQTTGNRDVLSQALGNASLSEFAQQSILGRSMVGRGLERELDRRRRLVEDRGNSFDEGIALQHIVGNRADLFGEEPNAAMLRASNLLSFRAASVDANSKRRSDDDRARIYEAQRALGSAAMMGRLPGNVRQDLITHPDLVRMAAAGDHMRRRHLRAALDTSGEGSEAGRYIQDLLSSNQDTTIYRTAQENLDDLVRRGGVDETTASHLMRILDEDATRSYRDAGVEPARLSRGEQDALLLGRINEMAMGGDPLTKIEAELRNAENSTLDRDAMIRAGATEEDVDRLIARGADLQDAVEGVYANTAETTKKLREHTEKVTEEVEETRRRTAETAAGGGSGGGDEPPRTPPGPSDPNDPDDLDDAVAAARRSRTSQENRARGFEQFLAFDADETVTFSDDPYRDAEQRMLYRRMKNLASEEDLNRIRQGDVGAYQSTANRARRTTEFLQMGNAMFANAGGFAIAELGMAAAMSAAREVRDYEDASRSADALINLNRGLHGQNVDAFTNRARNAGNRIGASNTEMVELARTFAEEGGDANRAFELTNEMAGMVRATGESVQELSAYLAQAQEQGFADPAEIAEYAVARGVSLAEISEATTALGPELQGMSDRERAQAIVGFEESGGIRLSQNDAIRERQMERMVGIGRSSEAFADTDKAASAFQTSINKLGDGVVNLWESLKPGLTILANIASAFLTVTNGVMDFVNAMPGGDLLVSLGLLSAAIGAIGATIRQIQEMSFFTTAWDVMKESVSFIRSGLDDVARLVGNSGIFKNLMGAFDPNPQMGIIPPWMADMMNGGPSRDDGQGRGFVGEFFGEAAGDAVGGRWRRARRRGQVWTGRARQWTERNFGREARQAASAYAGRSTASTVTDLATTGAAAQFGSTAGRVGWRGAARAAAVGGTRIGMGLLTLAANPATLPLVIGAGVAYAGYRGYRNSRRRSRMDNLQDVASERDMMLAYSGELSTELENAGYTVEEVRKVIDEAANSGAGAMKRLAESVKESAKQYQALSKAAEDYGKTYDRIRTEESSRILNDGVAVLRSGDPLTDLVGRDNRIGSVYDVMREEGDTYGYAAFQSAGSEIQAWLQRAELGPLAGRTSDGFAGALGRWLEDVVPGDSDGFAMGADLRTSAQFRDEDPWITNRIDADYRYDAFRRAYQATDELVGGWMPNMSGGQGVWNRVAHSFTGGLRGSRANSEFDFYRVDDPAVADTIAAFQASRRATEELRQEIVGTATEGEMGGLFGLSPFSDRNRIERRLENMSIEEMLADESLDIDPNNRRQMREAAAQISENRIAALRGVWDRSERDAVLDERYDTHGILEEDVRRQRREMILDVASGDRTAADIGSANTAEVAEARLRAQMGNLERLPLELGMNAETLEQLELDAQGQIKKSKENQRILGEFNLSIAQANTIVEDWGVSITELSDQMRETARQLRQLQISDSFDDVNRGAFARGEVNPYDQLLGFDSQAGSVSTFSDYALGLVESGNYNADSDWVKKFVDAQTGEAIVGFSGEGSSDLTGADELLRNAADRVAEARRAESEQGVNREVALNDAVNDVHLMIDKFTAENPDFNRDLLAFSGGEVDEATFRDVILRQSGARSAGIEANEALFGRLGDEQANVSAEEQRAIDAATIGRNLQDPTHADIALADAQARAARENEQIDLDFNQTAIQIARRYAQLGPDGNPMVLPVNPDTMEHTDPDLTDNYTYKPVAFASDLDEALYDQEMAALRGNTALARQRVGENVAVATDQHTVDGFERALDEATLEMNQADRVSTELASYRDFLNRMGSSLDDAVEARLIDRRDALEEQLVRIEEQSERDQAGFRKDIGGIVDDFTGRAWGGGEAGTFRDMAEQIAANQNMSAEERARWGISSDPLDPFLRGPDGERGYMERLYDHADRYQSLLNFQRNDTHLDQLRLESVTSGNARFTDPEGLANSVEEQLYNLRRHNGDLEAYAQERIDFLIDRRTETNLDIAREQAEHEGREFDPTSEELDTYRAEAAAQVMSTDVARYYANLPSLESVVAEEERTRRNQNNAMTEWLYGDANVTDASDRLAQLDTWIEENSTLGEGNAELRRARELRRELVSGGTAVNIDDAEELWAQAQIDTEGMQNPRRALQIQRDALNEAVELMRERGESETIINAIFGSRLRMMEQESEALERQNEEIERRIAFEGRLLDHRMRLAEVGGTLRTQNAADVEREAIRLEMDLEQITFDRDERIRAAQQQYEDGKLTETQANAEMTLAYEAAEVSEAERNEEYRRTLTGQATSLAEGNLGRFETFGDRIDALDAIFATGALAEEDVAELRSQTDAIRQAAQSGFGTDYARLTDLRAEGDPVSDALIQSLTSGYANQDAQVQEMSASAIRDAIGESDALRSIERESRLDPFETLNEQIDRTTRRLQELTRLGAGQEGLYAEEMERLVVEAAGLEERRRVRTRITDPADRARRELDDFDGSEGARVGALESYEEQLRSILAGETNVSAEDILGMSSAQLEETFGNSASELENLAQQIESAAEQAESLAAQLARVEEVMGVSEARIALEDIQRGGGSAAEVRSGYEAQLSELDAVIEGRLWNGTPEEALDAARRGDTEALAGMVRIREGETAQEAAQFLQEQLMSRFNLGNQMVGDVLNLNQSEIVDGLRSDFGISGDAPMTAEQAIEIMSAGPERMREALGQFAGSGVDLTPWKEAIEEGRFGQDLAMQFIDADLARGSDAAMLRARRGDFGAARGDALRNQQRTYDLVRTIMDQQGISVEGGIGGDAEADAAALRALGQGGLADLILGSQAPLEAIDAQRGRDQIRRTNARYAATGPLFESQYTMLGWERARLQEVNDGLRESGQVVLDGNNKIVLEESNAEMAEVWAANMKRMQEITEERSLAIVSLFHGMFSGMVSDLRNTVSEGLSMIVTEGLFGGAQRERDELDREFQGEADLTQDRLASYEQYAADIREQLEDPDLGLERRRELREQLDDYNDRIADLKDELKAINHEWDLQAEKIKTVGERLTDLMSNLGERFMNRFLDGIVNLAFNGIFGGGGSPLALLAGAGAQASSTGGSTSPATGTLGNVRVTSGGVTTSEAATAGVRRGEAAWEGQQTQQANLVAGEQRQQMGMQAIGAGLTSFGTATQGGMMGGLMSGGLSLAMSGALTNPIALAAVGVGSALGDLVKTTKWWNERLREEAQGMVRGVTNLGVDPGYKIDFQPVATSSDSKYHHDYSGTRTGEPRAVRVDMNVKADLSDYATSRELGRRIQTETRRTSNKAGLYGG